jgi:hypothetical protein
MTPDTPPSLDRQVADTASSRSPDPRRRLSAVWAFASLAAFAAAVAVNASRLAPPVPTDEEVLTETIEVIELTRRAVERFRDSTGVVPTQLSEVGLGMLPLDYEIDGDEYELSSPSPFGDVVGYRGAARAGGAR